MSNTQPINPGKGYRLLPAGTTIRRGDQFYHPIIGKWVLTRDAGLLVKQEGLTYRRKMTKAVTLNLGPLTDRAIARASVLGITLTAYVRQCVAGELNRANIARIQGHSPNANPPMHHRQNGESD